MDKQHFLQYAGRYPVAAAIKSQEEREKALDSEVALLFLLKGDAFKVADFVQQAHQRGKGVAVHIDLLSGIGKDRAGVNYLQEIGVDAIITSHSQLIAAGREAGVTTIQRLLLLDKATLERGVKTIGRANPDLVEVLPGIIFPEIAPQLRKLLPGPFIGGGFIRTFAEVAHIHQAGALLCSSSTSALWNTSPINPEKASNW